MADGSKDPAPKDSFTAQFDETRRRIARLGCYLTTTNLAEPMTNHQLSDLLHQSVVEEKKAEQE